MCVPAQTDFVNCTSNFYDGIEVHGPYKVRLLYLFVDSHFHSICYFARQTFNRTPLSDSMVQKTTIFLMKHNVDTTNDENIQHT